LELEIKHTVSTGSSRDTKIIEERIYLKLYTKEDHENVIEEINQRMDKIPVELYEDHVIFTFDTKENIDNAFNILAYTKRFLRAEMKKMDLKSPLTQKYISDYFNIYTSISTFRALCRMHLAKLRKQTNPNDNVNDGSGKQHWIPNCYVKHFSDENNELSRWTLWDLELGLASPIHPNGPFREIEENKGKHYPPDTELILSEFETDYSEVMTNEKYDVFSPWNHMVITLFFYLLSVRTFEQKRKSYVEFIELTNNDFSGAHKYIVNHSISLLNIDIDLNASNKAKMFITQDPATRYSVKEEGEIILAPYDSTTLIIIQPGFSSALTAEREFLIKDFLLRKMMDTTTYEDQHIYCHPDGPPFRILPASLVFDKILMLDKLFWGK
jgi:hypothetical protein